MLMFYITIFILVAQSSVWSISLGDPCTVIIWSDTSKGADQIINITVPKNCQSGAVYWNYPMTGRQIIMHCRALQSDTRGHSQALQNITIRYLLNPTSSPIVSKGSAFLPYNSGGKHVQLCIQEIWTTEFTRVQELVDGHYKNVALPTKDTPSCTTSSNGNAALLISASEPPLYLTAFSYRITEDKSSQNETTVKPRKHN